MMPGLPIQREGYIVMNRAEFEADLVREGYSCCESALEPNRHSKPHTHDFDARVFVLEGSIELALGYGSRTYGPGDHYTLLAGTTHAEHTEAGGVKYVAGRRTPE